MKSTNSRKIVCIIIPIAYATLQVSWVNATCINIKLYTAFLLVEDMTQERKSSQRRRSIKGSIKQSGESISIPSFSFSLQRLEIWSYDTDIGAVWMRITSAWSISSCWQTTPSPDAQQYFFQIFTKFVSTDTIQEKVDPIISTSQFNCHLKEQIITGLLRWSIYFKKRYEDGSDGSWNKKNCKQDRNH